MNRHISKLYFLGTVSAAALSLGVGYLARRRSLKAVAQGAALDASQRRPWQTCAQTDPSDSAVLYRAGLVADWWCHRSSRIQNTTGLKETIIHLLMLAEAGFPVIAGLFLEINPIVLSAMIAAFFLSTAMWDVSYAVTAREVTPMEQHVHSFLEIVPLMAVAFVSLLHWPQLEALAGLHIERPALFQPKREPLSRACALTTLGAMLTLELLPYVETAETRNMSEPIGTSPPSTPASN